MFPAGHSCRWAEWASIARSAQAQPVVSSVRRVLCAPSLEGTHQRLTQGRHVCLTAQRLVFYSPSVTFCVLVALGTSSKRQMSSRWFFFFFNVKWPSNVSVTICYEISVLVLSEVTGHGLLAFVSGTGRPHTLTQRCSPHQQRASSTAGQTVSRRWQRGSWHRAGTPRDGRRQSFTT